MSRNVDVKPRALKTIEGLPVRGEVTMKPLMAGDHMVMMETHIPVGATTPLHAHQHESLVYVVKGRLRFVIGDETHTLGAGDTCRHPVGVLHNMEALEEAAIIEIKSPPLPLEQFLGTD